MSGEDGGFSLGGAGAGGAGGGLSRGLGEERGELRGECYICGAGYFFFLG